MKHLGLFEGIGGFSLAARWMGWETIAWCEWNEFGQKVLRHHFPKAEGYGDITKTDSKKNDTPTDVNNVLAAAVCPKCRTKDFDSCNSIRCPMRKVEETVKTQWDIRKCFEQLRFDKDHHLGLGDIRLTIGQQEEICELVERFYRCR